MFTTYSYTVWYLIGKFKPWRSGFAPILLLINLLCSLAMYVLATRITDNKHHTWDVGAGAGFGIVFGTVSYFIYFENPFGKLAGAPKWYVNLYNGQCRRKKLISCFSRCSRPDSPKEAFLAHFRDEELPSDMDDHNVASGSDRQVPLEEVAV